MRRDDTSMVDCLAFAHEVLDRTGQIIRRAITAEAGRSFVTKGDQSPVTAIDREVETVIRQMIEATFPSHGILGEELAPSAIDRELVWVIDPIDGTKQLITGIPVFGTLLALTRNGLPILGVIDHPVTAERWSAAEGLATVRNGRPVRARRRDGIQGSIMATTNPELYDLPERRAFAALRAQASWCVYGASCYAYGRLASGAIDIGIEVRHDPFDYCALVPVIAGAGGVITDWEGRPLTISSGDRFVASGDPALHEAVLATLAEVLAAS